MSRPTAPTVRRRRANRLEARGAAVVLLSMAASATTVGLTLVFIALKLFHVVDWRWATVFSPTIAGIVLSVLFAAGLFVAAGVVAFKESK